MSRARLPHLSPQARAPLAAADAGTAAARWLILRAAHQCAAPLGERLLEEWLADLETRGSAPARIRFALGCCWATVVIARERAADSPLVVAAGVSLPASSGEKASALSRRATVSFAIIGLHLLAIRLLLGGLSWEGAGPHPSETLVNLTYVTPTVPSQHRGLHTDTAGATDERDLQR